MGGKYQPIKPDERGRLLSQTTEVLFGVYNKGRRLRLKDARTGKWLLTAQESEDGRLKVEKQLEVEIKARTEIEKRLQEEAQIRAQLEKRLRELEAKNK